MWRGGQQCVNNSFRWELLFLWSVLVSLRPAPGDCPQQPSSLQVQQAREDNVRIKVTVLNDESVQEGLQGVTTSMDIVKLLDKKLQKAALSAKIDGKVWDLIRPLESDCTLQILTWEDLDGKDVSFLVV